jgi:hypothetical protein
MGSLKTVPPSSFLIVPLGDFHIFFKLNSLTFKKIKLIKNKLSLKHNLIRFYSCFIRSYSGTLDSHLVLFDSFGTINSDLVISGISVLHRQIEVLFNYYLLQSSSPKMGESGAALSSPK